MIVTDIVFNGINIKRVGNIYMAHYLDNNINIFSESHAAEGDVPIDHQDYQIFRKEGGVHEFGVADSLEQIEAHIAPLLTHPKSWAIRAFEAVKDQKPTREGWQWDGWGPYIGAKAPKQKYLNLEGPEIMSVWCFRAHEVLPRVWTEHTSKGTIGTRPVTINWLQCARHGKLDIGRVRSVSCKIVDGPSIDFDNIEAERHFGISFKSFREEFWAIVQADLWP